VMALPVEKRDYYKHIVSIDERRAEEE